jgi:hypothetical protein
LWGKAHSGGLKLGLRMNVVHLDAYPGAVHRRSAPLHRGRADAFRVDWAASGRRYVRIQRRGLRCIVVHGSNPMGVLTRYTGDTLAFSPPPIVDEAQVLRAVK